MVEWRVGEIKKRSKGRDLFDLWLALIELKLQPSDILLASTPYRPEGMSSKKAIETFAENFLLQHFGTI